MKIDPRPFVEAALSGICSRPIHANIGTDAKGRPAIVPGADPAQIGGRAVELGLATAAALEAALEALEALEDEATKPRTKTDRKAG